MRIERRRRREADKGDAPRVMQHEARGGRKELPAFCLLVRRKEDVRRRRPHPLAAEAVAVARHARRHLGGPPHLHKLAARVAQRRLVDKGHHAPVAGVLGARRLALHDRHGLAPAGIVGVGAQRDVPAALAVGRVPRHNGKRTRRRREARPMQRARDGVREVEDRHPQHADVGAEPRVAQVAERRVNVEDPLAPRAVVGAALEQRDFLLGRRRVLQPIKRTHKGMRLLRVGEHEEAPLEDLLLLCLLALRLLLLGDQLALGVLVREGAARALVVVREPQPLLVDWQRRHVAVVHVRRQRRLELREPSRAQHARRQPTTTDAASGSGGLRVAVLQDVTREARALPWVAGERQRREQACDRLPSASARPRHEGRARVLGELAQPRRREREAQRLDRVGLQKQAANDIVLLQQ